MLASWLHSTIASTLIAAAITMACVGCSRPITAHLQGAVTLSGKRLPANVQAFIVFAAGPNRSESVSVPIVDGRYDSPHTPRGDITVFFEINHSVGPERKSRRTGLMVRDIATLVPPRYATGVGIKVDGDNANQNFDLEP